MTQNKKLIEVDKIDTKEIKFNVAMEIYKEIPKKRRKEDEVKLFSNALNNFIKAYTDNRENISIEISVF